MATLRTLSNPPGRYRAPTESVDYSLPSPVAVSPRGSCPLGHLLDAQAPPPPLLDGPQAPRLHEPRSSLRFLNEYVLLGWQTPPILLLARPPPGSLELERTLQERG